MKAADTVTMVYYVIKFITESYTIQEETMYNGQISNYDELVVKNQYMNCMQYKMKFFWEHKPQQNNTIFPHAQLYIHAWMSPPSPK